MSDPVLVTTSQQLRDAIFAFERAEAETGTVVATISFPRDANCFLFDAKVSPGLCADLERVRRLVGRTVLCLSMRDLSELAGQLLPAGTAMAHVVGSLAFETGPR